MTAPRLNRKLALEATTRLEDGAGGYVEAWQVLGTLWAQVLPRSGREAALVGAAISATSYRIVVRGAPEGAAQRSAPGQRFRDGTRLFHIEAVTEHDADGRYLTCFASEEAAV